VSDGGLVGGSGLGYSGGTSLISPTGTGAGDGGGGGGGGEKTAALAAAAAGGGEGAQKPKLKEGRCPFVSKDGVQCRTNTRLIQFSCQCGMNGLCAIHRYADQVSCITLMGFARGFIQAPSASLSIFYPSHFPPHTHYFQHSCTHDYAEAQRKLLEKGMPAVRGTTLSKL
jgi:hypothetical protein